MAAIAQKGIVKSGSEGKESRCDMCENLEKLCSALNEISIAFNNASKAMIAFSKIGMLDGKSNNWRKLHGMPMRRRVR